jgi:hypothetical protein
MKSVPTVTPLALPQLRETGPSFSGLLFPVVEVLTYPSRNGYRLCMLSETQRMYMAMRTLGGALSTFGV